MNDEIVETFIRNHNNQEAICEMTKRIINAPEFDRIIQQLHPLVISCVKNSQDAPKLSFEFPKINVKQRTPKSTPVLSKKIKGDSKSMLATFREEMGEMDMVATDEKLVESIIKTKESEDDDSFVFVEDIDSRPVTPNRRSVGDILGELGFYDTKENLRLMELFDGDIDRVIDALLDAPSS